jgi:hypothetical protein
MMDRVKMPMRMDGGNHTPGPFVQDRRLGGSVKDRSLRSLSSLTLPPSRLRSHLRGQGMFYFAQE